MVKAAAALGMLLAALSPCWGAGPAELPASPAAVGASPTADSAGLAARSASPTADSAGLAARSASPAASTQDLPALPPRPSPAEHQRNAAWEDFTVVTLISAPFTALWCGLGAALVSAFSRGRLPLSTNSPLFGGAACTAAVASVSIGLISIDWGGASQARPLSSSVQTLPAPAALSGTAR
jgi:hypothetical protein